MPEATTFCRLCLASCGVTVTTDDHGAVVRVRGRRDHELSAGYTCAKGRALGTDHHHPGRLDEAHLGRGAGRVAAPAEVAVADLAARLRSILDSSGPDAIAFYRGNSAGFDRAGLHAARWLIDALGTRSAYSATSLDGVAKVAVSALMTGMRSDTLVPIIDYDACRLGLVVGANPVVSHGHDWALSNPVQTLKALRGRGELWVIDPRETETARLATKHLRPRPGTDHVLLACVLRSLLAVGPHRVDHAVGVDELAAAVRPYTEDVAEAVTGVSRHDLAELVASVRRTGRLGGRSGTGVSMSPEPTVTEWLLWALHVITGSMEVEGGLWFQPDFFLRADRAPSRGEVSASHPSPRRPELAGWRGERASAGLADDVLGGHVQALIVFGGNPVTAFPATAEITRALHHIPVLAVADVMRTGTTDAATHVLPCLGQLERADLNVSSRYAREVYGEYTAAVVEPSPGRRPMWWYFARLAEQLGLDGLPAELLGAVADEDVLGIIARSAEHGLDELRAAGAPVVLREVLRRPWVRDHVLTDGRWDVAPAPLVERLATLSTRRPGLRLLARRQPSHVNAKLVDVVPAAEARLIAKVHVSPVDADGRGIGDGDRVTMSNAQGSVDAAVELDATLPSGCVSLTHGVEAVNVNVLTSSSEDIDPISGMPLLSGVEVELGPAP